MMKRIVLQSWHSHVTCCLPYKAQITRNLPSQHFHSRIFEPDEEQREQLLHLDSLRSRIIKLYNCHVCKSNSNSDYLLFYQTVVRMKEFLKINSLSTVRSLTINPGRNTRKCLKINRISNMVSKIIIPNSGYHILRTYQQVNINLTIVRRLFSKSKAKDFL